MIYTIINLFFEIVLLWYLLRIIETTKGKIEPRMDLNKLSSVDKIFYVLWIIGFLMLPVFSNLSIQTKSENFGLFFSNLIFGKFFLDVLLPSFETENTLKGNLKLFLLGPIANLISAVLVIRLFSWLLGGLTLFDKETKVSMNLALNFLADLWVPYQFDKIGNNYLFPIGFASLAFLVIFVRVSAIKLNFTPKFLLIIGMFCLMIRCLKYSGNEFNQLMSLNIGSLSKEYNWANFIAIFSGWIISIIIKWKSA